MKKKTSTKEIFRTFDQHPNQTMNVTPQNSGRKQLPPKGLVIFPRRKAGALSHNSNVSHPVVITKELLQNLADFPLCQASEILGISVTALKRACRKVGVSRWPRKNALAYCAINRLSSNTFQPEVLQNQQFGQKWACVDNQVKNTEIIVHNETTDAETEIWLETGISCFPGPQTSDFSPVHNSVHPGQTWIDCAVSRSCTSNLHPESESGLFKQMRRGSSICWADSPPQCASAWSMAQFGDGLSMEVAVLDLPELF